MKIDRILQGLRETQKPSEKTASAASTPAAKSEVTNPLVNAMNEALAAAPSTQKTAAEAPVANPVNDVMKLAADMAKTENEAMVKQAQVMGAAFADTVVARLEEWRKTAAALPTIEKIATGDPEFDKFAAENPAIIKEASTAGYPINRAGLEKMAEDNYVAGYNDTVVAIHKTAALEFLKGASVCAQVLEGARKSA